MPIQFLLMNNPKYPRIAQNNDDTWNDESDYE